MKTLSNSCSSSQELRLASLYHTPGSGYGTSAVQFPRSRGGTYTVSLRTGKGYDATMTSTYKDKVAIHYKLGTRENSQMVKALSAGQTFTDSNQQVTITVYSIT